jgi:hypothetical protein
MRAAPAGSRGDADTGLAVSGTAVGCAEVAGASDGVALGAAGAAGVASDACCTALALAPCGC